MKFVEKYEKEKMKEYNQYLKLVYKLCGEMKERGIFEFDWDIKLGESGSKPITITYGGIIKMGDKKISITSLDSIVGECFGYTKKIKKLKDIPLLELNY